MAEMMGFNQVQRYTNLGKMKIYKMIADGSHGFPKPAQQFQRKTLIYRFWNESDIYRWFEDYKTNQSEPKRIEARNAYFKTLARFTDRTRPEIDPGAMILKYSNIPSSQSLSWRDGDYIRQFDSNYQRFL